MYVAEIRVLKQGITGSVVCRLDKLHPIDKELQDGY